MKYSPYLCLLLIFSNLNAETEYNVVIEQSTSRPNSTETTDEYLQNTVGLSGTTVAERAITQSASFELSTIDDEGNSTIHATKFVGALPRAEVEIIALDRVDGNAKTRVGSPFDVKITVDGLLDINVETEIPRSEIPDAAKWVDVYHTYTKYAPGAEESLGSGQLVDTNSPIKIDENGTEEYLDQYSQISFFSEENITVYSQPDFGFPDPGEIATAKILVYPETTGKLVSTLKNNDRVQSIPEIRADLFNVYPGKNEMGNTSYWAVLFYPGNKRSSHTKQELDEYRFSSNPTTGEELLQDKPNSDIMMLPLHKRANKYGQGTYTIELVQETVHGLDSLDSITFYYDSVVKVNGNITSGQ